MQPNYSKNYLAAGQRARRRHPKTIWHWDIEVVQNLKECTENLLSSRGAILFGQSVRKNRQNAPKAERFAKTSQRTRILLEIQESHFEDVEDLDEVVEGGRGASRHIENTSNAFLEDTEIVSASHAASAAAYRVPRSWQSWDLLLQVVPFCMYCGSNQRHWMPLLICGRL